MNNKHKNDLNSSIDDIAIKYVKDKKICSTALIGMINIYKKSYNIFIDANYEVVKNCLNKREELSSKEINLAKLFSFLSSWETLVNKKGNKINDKKFGSYKKLNSKELEDWNETLRYAENEKNLVGIKELNDNLQFIIAFNESPKVKRGYFKRVLLEVQREEEQEEKDYSDNKNIYSTLFKIFKPKINQYNYLQKTGN